MKRAALACGLWLLLASHSLADWRDAVCRLSHPAGGGRWAVGSGCVFGSDRDAVYILTNGHVVAGSGGSLRVEFFPARQRLDAVAGRVAWTHFTDHHQGYARDLAVVRVERQALGEFSPPVVRLAAADTRIEVGQVLTTHGCKNGDEPTTFAPRVVATNANVFDFTPEGAGGRSGSPIVDTRSGRIVGVIAWGSGTGFGTAIALDEVRDAFAGRQPTRGLFAPRSTRQVLRMPPAGDLAPPLLPIEQLPGLASPAQQQRPVQEEPCPNCPPMGGGHGPDGAGQNFPPYTGPGSSEEDPDAPPDDPDHAEEDEPPPRVPIPRPKPPAEAEPALPPNVGPVAPVAPQPEAPLVAAPPVQPPQPPICDDGCDLCPPNHGHKPAPVPTAPQTAGSGNWQSIAVPIPKLGDAAYAAILGAGGAIGLPWLARVLAARFARRAVNTAENRVATDLYKRLASLERQLRAARVTIAEPSNDDLGLADPPGVVERTKVRLQRVPTTDHEFEKLKDAITRVVECDRRLAPVAEQIFGVYEQLIAGELRDRNKLRSNNPPGTKLGWEDPKPQAA